MIGSMKFKATETGREVIEILGDATDAFSTGKTWIMDEVMSGPPDVMVGTHQFLDRRVQSTDVFINGPMTLRRHPRFRVIATDNTWGLGENAAEFAGTQVHNGAFLNRFTYRVELDYLKPLHETSVIMKTYTAAWVTAVDKMVAVANKLRKDKRSGVLTQAMTTRTLLSWVRECLDREKRLEKAGEKPRLNLPFYWKHVVIPAASPTYLLGNPDGDVIKTYLELKEP
jgi:MoxR-like ATPase